MELKRSDFESWRDVLVLYKIPLGLGIVSVFCICISVILLVRSAQTQAPIVFTLGTATESGELRSRTIVVDVAGAVIRPGVYSLGEGARIDDAIRAAGGLSDTVSTKLLELSVNRAARVSDGSKVYIPEKPDEEDGATGQSIKTSTSHNQNVQRIDDTSHILEATISINNATQQELETLSGVGPATASKIIAGRPYTSFDQLVTRKVIGQKLLDKIQAQLSL